MYIGIVRSRYFRDYDHFSDIMNNFVKQNIDVRIDEIICSNAKGTSKLVIRWCEEHGITYKILSFEWNKYGSLADIIVYADMMNKCEHMLVF